MNKFAKILPFLLGINPLVLNSFVRAADNLDENLNIDQLIAERSCLPSLANDSICEKIEPAKVQEKDEKKDENKFFCGKRIFEEIKKAPSTVAINPEMQQKLLLLSRLKPTDAFTDDHKKILSSALPDAKISEERYNAFLNKFSSCKESFLLLCNKVNVEINDWRSERESFGSEDYVTIKLYLAVNKSNGKKYLLKKRPKNLGLGYALFKIGCTYYPKWDFGRVKIYLGDYVINVNFQPNTNQYAVEGSRQYTCSVQFVRSNQSVRSKEILPEFRFTVDKS